MPIHEYECQNERCSRKGEVVEELFSSVAEAEKATIKCEECLVPMEKIMSKTDWKFSGTSQVFKPRKASQPKSYVKPKARRKNNG